MIPENYMEKTYAGWLGKMIGIRMGAPIEGFSKEKIRLLYGGRIDDYLVDYNDFASDDDSNGPLYLVRALEHYENITPREMGYTLLNYVPKEHGFFWWGQEFSTEHTAYKNLLSGIEAPESGSEGRNGKELAEQIGGQIFIDGFGFAAPGNPKLACELAEASARVTHDLEGISGARFVAACISLAYIRTSITQIIKEALSYINQQGSYYKVVTHMIKCMEAGRDSEEAFQILKEHYWTDKYPGVCHIIPNAGILALSLLYGEGSFSKTMELVNLCGFDTDCNAGNAGAIMGVLCCMEVKEKGIPEKWILPIKDLVLGSGITGSLNISTISENTLMFTSIGYRLAGEDMPSPYKEFMDRLTEDGIRTAHFEFPHALHGFRIKGNYKNAEVRLSNTMEQAYNGGHSLKLIVNNLHPENSVYIFQKTYYAPEDLHDARYQPAFSPVVYPGDEVSCYLKNSTGQKLKVYLYFLDWYSKKRVRFAETDLYFAESSDWIAVQGRIPHLKNSLIKEIGLELVSKEETDTYFGEQVCVFLDEFQIKANPSYSIEFAKIPIEDYTLHRTEQLELSGFTHYNPGFIGIFKTKEGLILSDGEKIVTGDYYWRNYKCRFQFVLLNGNQADFFFRCQGCIRSYSLRISKEQLTLLSLFENKEIELGSALISLEYGKEYTIDLIIKENTFQVLMEGKKLLAEDTDNRYTHGSIGFGADGSSSILLIGYTVTSII